MPADLLALCFLFSAYDQTGNEGNILAPHSVSAAKGWSPGSLLVERSLILKSDIEPTVVV